MKCYANRVNSRLLSIPPENPVVAPVNGGKFRIFPDQSDHQTDAVQDFVFITVLVFAGGANSPTAQLVIQGSTDGQLWIDLVLGTVRTEAGTYVEGLNGNGFGLLPWVRARLVLAGGTPPSVSANVEVVSTGAFQLSNS